MFKLKKTFLVALASAMLLTSFPYHTQAQTNPTLAIDARFDSVDIQGFKEGLVAVQ
ncbi:hypothetical protein SAMN03159341_12936 [Paenibacillus sp. 1_12]|uniref:hypothetical protein n=1 Tax=Paenibacillus sp. 1_12 TaxID=1566278 RepID=UPI0008E6F24B|nr:hypothetical protein [Paenibacillus sp. 1_12]SFM37803.1 hypothetical protein SAMN03159341_12936 [Paenibacillus sp. 1_12]